ncbi:MAG: outer membrane beta-barrel protein [Alphaproteobacteria bacterium]
MKKPLAALALLSVFLPASVWAAASASPAPQTANYGDFYVGLGAGIVIPQSTSVTATGAITGSGNLNYDDGAGVLGMAGYHLNDYLAGEAEFGYSSVDYSNISGTLNGVSGTIGVSGHSSAVVGLANAIVSPLGRSLGVIPYAGGGLGFASTDSHISSLSVGGTTVPVNSSHSETDFALDAIAGLDVPVADGFSLGGRYQYLWINSSTSASGGGTTVHEGNFGANVLTVQVTYRF